MIRILLAFGTVVGVSLADVSHILEEPSTPPPPPKPYAFGYAAGRFPGHIDRTHSEVSDGSGVVQGSYSYVDPRFQIRTVEYIADKNGFHPVLNKTPPPLPKDSEAVQRARERHFAKFNAIAQAHQAGPGEATLPSDSRAVQNAKVKHFNLYQQIAEEHARIAAERKALGLVEEQEHEEAVDPNYLQH